MGYSQQTLSGFSWQTVLKFVISGITFVKIIILARLLSPTDFGIFSLVAIALGITEAITQTGVNITLLQVKDDLKSYISSAWVISIVRGFFMSLVMIILGFILKSYYNQAQLLPMTTMAALIPVIKGFINPYVISMQKDFKFRKETIYYATLQIFESVASIALALLFQNPWIFIIAMLLSACLEVIMSFALFLHRPRWSYNKTKGTAILKHTRHFSVNALFSYLLENVDNVIVGKILGTSNLGIYQNGYAIGHKVNYDFAKSFNHSALPTFTKIIDDKVRVRRGFIRLLTLTVGLVLVASLPLLLFPDPLVRLALGDQWLDIIPILPLLVWAGIIQSAVIIHYTVLYALKKVPAINMHLIVSFVMLVPAIIIGSQTLGLYGATLAVLLTRLVCLPLLIYQTHRYLQ